MKRVLVDTNVLVSLLTARNLQQQQLAAKLFSQAAEGDCELVLHQGTMTELVYVLGALYDQPSSEIAEILADLLALPGVLTSDELSWLQVLEIWPAKVPDFGDAVLAATARLRKHASVATFDRTFARALQRLELGSYWSNDEMEDREPESND